MGCEKYLAAGVDLAWEVDHDVAPLCAAVRGRVDKVARGIAHALKPFEDVLLGAAAVGRRRVARAQVTRSAADDHRLFPAQAAIPAFDSRGVELSDLAGNDRFGGGGRRRQQGRSLAQGDGRVKGHKPQTLFAQPGCGFGGSNQQDVRCVLPEHLS